MDTETLLAGGGNQSIAIISVQAGKNLGSYTNFISNNKLTVPGKRKYMWKMDLIKPLYISLIRISMVIFFLLMGDPVPDSRSQCPGSSPGNFQVLKNMARYFRYPVLL